MRSKTAYMARAKRARAQLLRLACPGKREQRLTVAVAEPRGIPAILFLVRAVAQRISVALGHRIAAQGGKLDVSIERFIF